MQFLVILREFCRLLLGILITLAKISANLRINACEELVSFDVVSLFTKIPVDLAVKIAEERRKNFRTAPYFIMLAHLINYALNTIDNSLGN